MILSLTQFNDHDDPTAAYRFETLQTQNLSLRLFSMEDAPTLFRLSQEKGMRDWVPDQVYQSETQAEEVLKYLIAQYELPFHPHVRPFVVAVQLHSGELIGHVGLSARGNDIEIGYAIGKAHSGRGYASEAVKALMTWVGLHTTINKVIGIVASENESSARVLEKAEFKFQDETLMPYLGKQRMCKEYHFYAF